MIQRSHESLSTSQTSQLARKIGSQNQSIANSLFPNSDHGLFQTQTWKCKFCQTSTCPISWHRGRSSSFAGWLCPSLISTDREILFCWDWIMFHFIILNFCNVLFFNSLKYVSWLWGASIDVILLVSLTYPDTYPYKFTTTENTKFQHNFIVRQSTDRFAKKKSSEQCFFPPNIIILANFCNCFFPINSFF